MTAARRALAVDNLVTRAEIRAELRCSWEQVDALLAHCRPLKPGTTTLYRWGEVLDALQAQPRGATGPPAGAARGRPVQLVDDDWV